jgi:predicted RNA-binding Zn-ribbon protein involved in translation (DUF1610 family)
MTLNTDSASNTRMASSTNMRSSTRTVSDTRLVAFDKNNCPQCGEWLLAPDWSEYRSERCVRHTWSCEACGYAFETDVFFAAAA